MINQASSALTVGKLCTKRLRVVRPSVLGAGGLHPRDSDGDVACLDVGTPMPFRTPHPAQRTKHGCTGPRGLDIWALRAGRIPTKLFWSHLESFSLWMRHSGHWSASGHAISLPPSAHLRKGTVLRAQASVQCHNFRRPIVSATSSRRRRMVSCSCFHACFEP